MPNSTIETAHSVPERVFVTIPHASPILPLVPNQGFDSLRREVRSSYKKLLSELDAEIAALFGTAAPTPIAQPRKRWWR